MENYSDSDASSESEFDPISGSFAESDDDKSQDPESQDLEPEPSEYYNEYMNAPWNPDTQFATQLDTAQLHQLHAEIKAQAETPDPPYPKLPRSWPFQPFDVRILPDYVVHPIHYFELFLRSRRLEYTYIEYQCIERTSVLANLIFDHTTLKTPLIESTQLKESNSALLLQCRRRRRRRHIIERAQSCRRRD
jgi:hypothetical protein